MSRKEKLAAELTEVYPQIVSRIEDKISKVIGIMGVPSFESLFKDIDSRQRTQTCTKFFQYFATRAIEEVCDENNISLKAVDETGYDWLYEGLPVEQKIKTMLVNFDSYAKYNVKKYGVVNTSWTGNKATVSNNKKADTHLLLVFAINGNNIKSSMATIVSLEETRSKWKTGSGTDDSYSTLTIQNHTNGSHLIYGDYHFTYQSCYGVLREIR
jgi:hypothetical protein